MRRSFSGLTLLPGNDRYEHSMLVRVVASPVTALTISALLILLATVDQHWHRGAAGFLAKSGIAVLVVGWTIGVVGLLRRPRLPTLCFYLIFLGFACFVEATNFGIPRIISWLILIGLLLAIELVAIGLVQRLPRLFSTLFSVFYYAAVSSVIVGVFCYNLRFNAPMSAQTSAAFLQSTGFEAFEFISVYADARFAAVVIACLSVIVALSVAQHRVRDRHISLAATAAIAVVALTQFAYLYKPSKLYSATIGYVHTYYAELAALQNIQVARRNSVTSIAATKNTKGETYVLVIGEAAERGHMSLYGSARTTTPWMDEQIRLPNWIRFNHAYANYVQTVPALSLALTSTNQYNGKSYYASPSILDVARAAGFRTFWLSNQQGLGKHGNPISAIAETADTYIKINNNVTGSSADYFDSELVERFRQLKTKIHNNDNNLVVFHLMGSHQGYCRRYPLAMARFGSETPTSLHDRLREKMAWWRSGEGERKRDIDCYDNSLAFTDFVLSQIFAEAEQLPGFRAFVYMPDHAEAVDEGLAHDPQLFTFTMTHIPFVLWLSDAFMAGDRERARTLREHADTVWTNDLLYDFIVGLTGVTVQGYDPQYDLSSKSYSLNWETALTLHGARKVIDDPENFRVRQSQKLATPPDASHEQRVEASRLMKAR